MALTVSTFLMFQGNAEEAITLYTNSIEGSKILGMEKYAQGEAGKEGSLKHANFMLAGQLFSAIDSNINHQFGFTPSVSIFIACNSEAEVINLFNVLSEQGKIMMPLGTYPFSKKFAWFSDRFGLSWQVSFK